MASRQRLVVIGSGMAGARVVEELLQRGRDRFAITLLGEEPCGNYNRTLLSQVLSGAQDAADIFLQPASWYAENGVRFHAGERAVAVDRARRRVLSQPVGGGPRRAHPYDRLVIATGSRPVMPPIEGLRTRSGAPRPGVFVFRTLEDCRQLAGYATQCRRAVVIGGGLLGLEAGWGLRGHGVEVHIVHQHGHLMDRQLDPPAGAVLRAALERLGMRIHLQRRTVAVLGNERVTGLQFSDGTTLAADMVVLACGVRPNAELAAECGLTVARGIVVDDWLRSVADPAIYAVGECAEHRGTIYGLVGPVWEQARVAAEHLADPHPGSGYRGSRVVARLKVAGMDVTAMGEMEPQGEGDEVVQFLEPRRGIYKKLVIRAGALAGAILVGDGERAAYRAGVYDRGLPVPEERAALLFDLGGRAGRATLEEMTDATTVCHCNGVTRGAIRGCVIAGALGLHDVMRATRAGTGCGSCKTLVQILVDRFRQSEEGARTSAPARMAP